MIRKLKSKKGFSYVMTSVCLIIVLLLGFAIFEIIRINSIAAVIRDKFEDAIIATSVSQYAEMYQPLREGQASTHSYKNNRWLECNKATREQISAYMENAMSNGEIAQCTIRSIDFSVVTASLAPDDSSNAEDKFSIEGTVVFEIPYDFAWSGITPMQFTFDIKSQWRSKF